MRKRIVFVVSFAVVSLVVALYSISQSPPVRPALAVGGSLLQAAKPSSVDYVVTSNSDSSLMTCNAAGTGTNCSLRGAVQLANGSSTGASIGFSSTVTLITLGRPITLTHNNIAIFGNGHEVTRLKTGGNFPALVLHSNNNVINELWINATGSHAGTNQHGLVVTGTGSIISDNSLSDLGGDGILLQGGGGTYFYNNYIGVQTTSGQPWATCRYQNDQWGIRIIDSPNNNIDGTTIGCNALDGVGISGASSAGNNLHGNYIGVVAFGGPVSNTLAGVAMWGGAHNNLIGDAATQGNIIGANKNSGVYIGDPTTHDNVVQLNSIGISSTTNISNTWDGVTIANGAHDNWILTNTIAYNQYKGVYLTSGAYSNRLQANTIRLQSQTGVVIDGGAYYNTVGTGGQALGNTISGNAYDGVYIGGSATGLNAVFGNRIGTNAAGNAAEPNQGNGVYLNDSTSYNSIGYTGNERNIISGNCGDGILLGWGTHDNQILANDIGLNRSVVIANAPAMPAGGGGCLTLAGSADNLAKGDYASTAVSVHDSSARSSVPAAPSGGSPCGLLGNLQPAGPSANAPANPVGGGTCLPLPNRYDGIAIIGGFTNTVGGFSVDNYVMFNGGSGIYLNSGTYITNSAQHNLIAQNAVISNTYYGIIVDGGISGTTTSNVISRTTIANNGYDGIGERNGATLNTWSEVSISGNGGLGIDKYASSDSTNVVDPPFAFVDSVNKSTGVVNGHVVVFGTTKIELYRVAPDPSGYGEGVAFVGRATADGSGNWTITDSAPGIANGCYTTFVTRNLGSFIPNISYEFGPNTCRTFLPLVMK